MKMMMKTTMTMASMRKSNKSAFDTKMIQYDFK